jgi:hypothetical protein
MSDGQTIILGRNRETAHRVIDVAPVGSVVNVKPPRRTLDQNAKMHAMLSDLARAKPQGRVLPPEIWKALFMHEAGFKCTFEPSLDGQGVVPLGFKSSRLNKAEFSDLIEAINAYGAEHSVQWSKED